MIRNSIKEFHIRKRYIRSIPELLYKDDIKRHVVRFKTKSDAIIEKYDVAENGQPWMRTSKAFDEEYIYEMKDVVASPKTGAVWVEGSFIFGESCGSLNKVLSWNNIAADLNTKAKPVEGEVIVCASEGFYHFMVETLPAVICSVQYAPSSTLVVQQNAPGYVKEIASFLSEKVIYSDVPVKPDKVIFSGVGHFSGFVQRLELKRVIDHFRSKLKAHQPIRKIYISRSKEKRRNLANEIELEKRLVDNGFEILHMQDLSIWQQIDVIRESKLIVSPHGAGLANLVWAAETTTRVIEIFAHKKRNDCYTRLSAMLGLSYDYVICHEDKQTAGYIPIDEVVAKLP